MSYVQHFIGLQEPQKVVRVARLCATSVLKNSRSGKLPACLLNRFTSSVRLASCLTTATQVEPVQSTLLAACDYVSASHSALTFLNRFQLPAALGLASTGNFSRACHPVLKTCDFPTRSMFSQLLNYQTLTQIYPHDSRPQLSANPRPLRPVLNVAPFSLSLSPWERAGVRAVMNAALLKCSHLLIVG